MFKIRFLFIYLFRERMYSHFYFHTPLPFFIIFYFLNLIIYEYEISNVLFVLPPILHKIKSF